jgi:hypothetical protein
MDDVLQEGVNAYKSGDHETARRLFISATKQSPNSERAWGWLYNVCKTDKERIHCLNQITRINPDNIKAKELLAKLNQPEEPPLEQPVRQVVPNPAPTSPHLQSQRPQIIENIPWYRSTLAYILLYIFINPLWAILILTDKKQGSGVKILALIFSGIFIISCCFSPALFNGNNSGGGTTTATTYDNDTSAWAPSGFEKWDNETAYRFVKGKSCTIDIAEACAHYEIYTRYGCPDSLYVEVAFSNTSDTQVDWGNDSATSLSPGSSALLEFVSFESSADQVHITQIKCY